MAAATLSAADAENLNNLKSSVAGLNQIRYFLILINTKHLIPISLYRIEFYSISLSLIVIWISFLSLSLRSEYDSSLIISICVLQ
jgi:hypothetical protein